MDSGKGQRRIHGLWVLSLTAGSLLLLFAWVASRGLMWFDTDSNWVKQAALVKLSTGRFAAPMAEGNIPHAALVYHWYPLYPAVLAAYVRFAGPSHAAHLWFDLGLNCLAAGIGAWWLVRHTRSGWVGAVYLLGVQYLVTVKLGRPETLTSLSVMLAAALTVNGRRQWSWIVGILLGCAVAASYPAGLACCAAWAAFVLAQEGALRRKLAGLVGTGALAVVTALAVWLHVVYPYWREAAEALSCNTRELGGSFGGLFNAVLATPRLALPLTAAFAFLTVVAWGPRGISGRLSADEVRLARASFWGVVGYLGVLLVVLRRPAPYYFPPLGHLLLPMAVYLLWRLGWQTGEARWPFGARLFAALGLVPVLAWFNVFLLRAAILPLGWTADSMTPTRAKSFIEATVPRTATLGGDGKLLTVVGTNWNFASLNWTGADHWPEYIVSPLDPASLEPTLYGFKRFGSKARERIEREYEPIPTHPAVPAPCEVARRVQSWGLPAPEYRNCDWFVRVWKRRDVGSLQADGVPGGHD